MNFNSRKFKKTLLNHVATIVAPYRSLLLAFSGGLDSTALLDILARLRKNSRMFKLRAYYINHGLNKNAEQWAIHCERECFQRNITFNIKRIILNNTSAGVEATARNARYRILADSLKDDEVLLTAQHQDDQVETFLLALKRGSGPAGLAAMPRDIPFFGHRLVRPLLDCSRVDIEKYVHEHRLSWVEDDSNNNLRFDRNFLRLKALPLLHQRWPQFSTAVERSAQLCDNVKLILPPGLGRILRHTLCDIDPILISNCPTHSTMCRINKKKESIYTSTLSEDTVACTTLGVSSIVRAPLSGEQVHIRFAPLSGMFHISRRCHRRTLRKTWKELDVPPWKRGIIPLLFYNNVLIAAMGVFITREGDAQYSKMAFRLVSRSGKL